MSPLAFCQLRCGVELPFTSVASIVIQPSWVEAHLCLQANPYIMMQTVILTILKVRSQLPARVSGLASLSIYYMYRSWRPDFGSGQEVLGSGWQMRPSCRVQALAARAGLGTSARDSLSPDGSSPGPPSTTHGSQEGDGPHHFLISPFALLVTLQTVHAPNRSPPGSHHQLGELA